MHALATGLITLAQQENAGDFQSQIGYWIVLLGVLALAPFFFTLITSFAKLVIIGGILRQALGTPQIPPNTIITGIALILTIHIMSPVAVDAYQRYQQQAAQREAEIEAIEDETAREARRRELGEARAVMQQVTTAVRPAMHDFLEKHAHRENVILFERLRTKLWSPEVEATVDELLAAQGQTEPRNNMVHDLVVLAPAFVLSELIEAFQIGFMIFVPFLVIDLVVSNILLAMGMHMLSPVTISLPFKLLLFVLIDGWTLVIEGVVLGYT